MERTKKHIVIAGGGFAGISTAIYLDRHFRRNPGIQEDFDILLINNHHSHLYTPALYEIAAVPQGEHTLKYVKASVAIPLADIFFETGVEWIEDEISSFNREKKEVLLSMGKRIPYEYLVLALGGETFYFNVPGAKEHSLPLKTFADAIRLRNRLQAIIDEEVKEVKIIVAGAGASGVEVAAEFENFICMLEDLKGRGRMCKARIILAEAGPEILPGFDPWTVKKARTRLEKLGVTISTNTQITAVDQKAVTLKDGSTMTYDILVWAGGVKASSTLGSLGLPLSPKGGIIVDQRLEAADQIFAVGDNAAFTDSITGKPLPWNVPVAEAEAHVAAHNIIASIKKSPKKDFSPTKRYPFILAVGQKYAIADLVFLQISGFFAWCLKQVVQLKYLLFILPFLEAMLTWWKYLRVSSSNDTSVSFEAPADQSPR